MWGGSVDVRSGQACLHRNIGKNIKADISLIYFIYIYHTLCPHSLCKNENHF